MWLTSHKVQPTSLQRLMDTHYLASLFELVLNIAPLQLHSLQLPHFALRLHSLDDNNPAILQGSVMEPAHWSRPDRGSASSKTLNSS